MRIPLSAIALAGLTTMIVAVPSVYADERDHRHAGSHRSDNKPVVQLGPRPYFLVDDMAESRLKRELMSCAAERKSFTRRDFSIGHRGAAMQFPEHTKESYEAAALMGAGILECDVTFTKDKELVCRHAQNDLHTTTNILATPLASKCIKPFTPATFDTDGNLLTPASAECRTSELTLAEFKSLRGKMDASNPRAKTVQEYLGGTANWRTDLYSGPTSGTLLTHKESIELFKRLGVDMTPELKAPSVTMPFDGFTQAAYAQKLIDEYKQAHVPPHRVWPQSFNIADVLHWVSKTPAYGKQAVYLDDANVVAELPSFAELADLRVAEHERERRYRRIRARPKREASRSGYHHLDVGTLRHTGRRQQRLLLSDHRLGDQSRRRRDACDRRARQAGRCAGNLHRLACYGDVLRKLHEHEVDKSRVQAIP
jgi:glycerophosphoryl diester phosphodiesterase